LGHRCDVAAEPRRTGGAYGPALPSQKANSEGARWGVTPSWHEHRPTALALRVVAGLGSSLDLSSPPWALPLHRPQVVVLMDPCKDPEDTLCVHQSREQTFIFDTVFDQHASQVTPTLAPLGGSTPGMACGRATHPHHSQDLPEEQKAVSRKPSQGPWTGATRWGQSSYLCYQAPGMADAHHHAQPWGTGV
jgi:hypothetical protein